MKKKCECCGELIDRLNISTSKYCIECSKEVQKQKTKERVRRFRMRKKSLINSTQKVHNLEEPRTSN